MSFGINVNHPSSIPDIVGRSGTTWHWHWHSEARHDQARWSCRVMPCHAVSSCSGKYATVLYVSLGTVTLSARASFGLIRLRRTSRYCEPSALTAPCRPTSSPMWPPLSVRRCCRCRCHALIAVVIATCLPLLPLCRALTAIVDPTAMRSPLPPRCIRRAAQPPRLAAKPHMSPSIARAATVKETVRIRGEGVEKRERRAGSKAHEGEGLFEGLGGLRMGVL